MKRLIPYIVLIAMIVCIALPVGIGYAKEQTVQLVIGKDKYGNLCEELDWGYSFTINPSKYEFPHAGKAVAKITIRNKGETAQLDMGDGTILTIQANSSVAYTYNVKLEKDEVKYTIRKLTSGTGVVFQESLNLRIVPKSDKKGGDLR